MTNSPEGGHWMALKGMGWLIAMKIIQRLNLGSNSFFASYEGDSGREVSNAIRSNKNPKKCLNCSFVHIHHQCFVLVGGVLARNWEQDHDHKLDDCTHMETKKQSLDRLRSTKSHIITLVYVGRFLGSGIRKNDVKWIPLEFPKPPQRSSFAAGVHANCPSLGWLLFFQPKKDAKGCQRIWKKLDRMNMNEHEWTAGINPETKKLHTHCATYDEQNSWS